MRNKKTVIKYTVTLLSLMLLALTCAFITLNVNNGYSFELKEQLKENYALNESIYIPHGTFDVAGKTVDADYQICYPNGNAYSKAYCTLDVAGKYTVKYFATVDGNVLTEEKSFTVINTLYAVSGSGSAFYSEELGGLDVEISAGSSFNYNKLINLSGYTSDDAIISFYVNAPDVQVRDFETLYITLTDAYDSENQIRFRAYAADNFPSLGYSKTLSYFSCSVGTKNYFVGISHDSGAISKGDRYGYWSQFSFSNQGQKGPGLDDVASFSLDYDKKDMYIRSSFAGKSKVSELGNPAFYSTPWEGFTNGLCYLSVSADNYINSSAEIVITEIAGDKLTETELNDTESPEIVINYNGFEAMPFGIKDRPYELFDAQVVDNSDVNCKLDVSVFYNYYTSKRENINIVDRKFTPRQTGIYTVIYSSQDSYGNAVEKVVELEVKSESAVSPLSVTVGQSFNDIQAGERVSLNNSFTVDSRAEELGDVKVKAYLVNVEGKTLLLEGLISDEFSVERRIFAIGESKVIYEFSDYIRTVIVQKSFNVTKPENNQFLQTAEEIGLPEFLVYGNDYILPDVSVVSYNADGTVKIENAKIYVVEDGELKTVENNKYTVNAKGESAKIRYVDSEKAENFIEKEIRVVSLFKDGKLKLENLFISDKATVSAMDSYISVETEEDAVINCVQELSVNDLSFIFDVNPAKNSFNEVLIRVSDSRVKGREIIVCFVKASNGTKVYLNKEYDGASYSVSADFGKSKNVNFQITVDGKNNTLTLENSVIEIKKYLNGEKFNGFPTGTVNVSIETSGVSGLSELRLMKLNGQPLCNVDSDSISPLITVFSSDEFSYVINDKYKTPIVVAYDVVCGLSNATVSVRKIGGDYLTGDDGVQIKNLDASKSYTLTFKEYGEYSVQIFTEDKNGQTFRQNLMVNVLDRVPPEITLNGEIKSEYKVGTETTLPTITVTDNISKEIEGFILVITPSGKYIVLTGGKYKFESVGEYKIRFIAYDEVGNMGLTEKTVKVG